MNPIKADIGILSEEKQYKFTGSLFWDLIELCGFYVRAYKPPWLDKNYDILVAIKHYYEDPGSTVLLLMNTDTESLDWLAAELLRTQQDKLYALFVLCGTPCHDEPYIETIRIAKEAAIVTQRFDEAADLRDIERKLQRGSY
jgi:hypothetical protein